MIKYIFPQPIYYAPLRNWDQIKKDILDNLDPEVEDIPHSYGSVPGHVTVDKSSYLEKIPAVLNEVDYHIHEFAKSLSIQNKFKCVHSWFNVYESNSLMAAHKHLPHDLAGVIFVQSTDKGGEFYFRNPAHDYDTIWLQQKYATVLPHNESQHFVEQKEGHILLFKAGIAHGVNFTGDTRKISVSFNYEVCDE